MANRITQVTAEVLAPGTPNARISQVTAEALTTGTPNARISQVVVEVLAPSTLVFYPAHHWQPMVSAFTPPFNSLGVGV